MNNENNNDNIITEVLEDGTIYMFDLDVCNKAAIEAIDMLFEKEGNEINYDFTATIFDLFIQTLYILNNSGWTAGDLIDEIENHLDDSDE